jgi:hypothetical protein
MEMLPSYKERQKGGSIQKRIFGLFAELQKVNLDVDEEMYRIVWIVCMYLILIII